MKPKLIIGLIGTIGSGKDVVSDYLTKKHGFKSLSMGDLAREELKSRNLKATRKNLQNIADEFTKKYGMTVWANRMYNKIINLDWEKVVINGIRRVEAIEVYREQFGSTFHLILINADPKIRFERLKSRARPGAPTTWEEFIDHEKNELALYKTFESAIALADYTIKNESNLESVYSKIDNLLKKITKGHLT